MLFSKQNSILYGPNHFLVKISQDVFFVLLETEVHDFQIWIFALYVILINYDGKTLESPTLTWSPWKTTNFKVSQLNKYD